MEENRNNGMYGMGGMHPNMGAMSGMGMSSASRPVPNGRNAGSGSTALVPVGKTAPGGSEKKKKPKKPNVAPNIFAVLLFLIMAGGLFLGMAGSLWSYLETSSLYLPSIVENNFLKGSLVGIGVDAVKNMNGYFHFDFSGGMLLGIMSALKNLLPAISLIILAISIVYAFIATLIALFSRMNGARALQIVSSCMLVGYGGCGFFTLIFGDTDFGCLALAGVGLLVAFITTMAVNKQIGVLNAFISVFSIAATVLFALPMSALRQYAFESDKSMNLIFGFVALGVLYLNLLFTSARICAKKGKIFDLVLHILQFAAITTVFVMAMISKDPVYNVLGMFMPLICAVGAPALALITLVLAIVIIFMPGILRKKAEKKAAKKAAAGEKPKNDKETVQEVADEQRPMNPVPPYSMPNGAAAPAAAQAQQQPMRPMPQHPMPQQQPMHPMPQQPMYQQTAYQQQPMPQRSSRRGRNVMDDEFAQSGGATSFKVPFSVGGNGRPDAATQEQLERLTAELRAMKNAQANPTVNVTSQDDSATRAALAQLTEQIRNMQNAQTSKTLIGITSQEDSATKAALEQLAGELREVKAAQAKAEEERRLEEEARLEAERKAQDEARIAEAERIAAEARAEAERIQKEAAAKAEQVRLEAARATEEERKKLEEERRKLEEERKAAEQARLEAERKVQQEKEEAERRAAEAKAEAERQAAERRAEAERQAQEEARLEAERQAAEARAEAARLQREAEEARAEAERQAAEAKAEAERIQKEAAEARAAAKAEAERQAAEAKAEAEKQAAEARAAAKAEAERQAAEARAAAEKQAAEARAAAQAEAERQAAETRRKLEEERQKLEQARLEAEKKAQEERQKLEEERKAMEAARLEDERKRKEEMEQFKRELLEMKNAQAKPAPEENKDMSKIMEELRALKEAQANAGSTTVNYMQDDSNKKELSEFEKRMEDLIKSQQKKEEPKPKREPSAFEKRMAELAAKKAAAAAAKANGEATEAPKPAPKPAAAPAPAPASNEPARYNTTQAPDPFIATLTTAELNEFGDAFIADKFGILSYMPAYVIGGDNKSFFNKMFISLGKVRSHISQPLLDKLFKYMRSAR